ncbi:MAG TPA: ABC transporter permease [Acidimicrobiales bacterium]|nr:ABC transporter permease [Acidimicrobiales bacterium]
MTTATLTPTRPLVASAATPRVRALPVLTARRLALTVRSPRALLVPLLGPVMFAMVVAPALANTVSSPAGHARYMTFVSLATAGLLIPLNCLLFGLGVLVDRRSGAMRELLVAPIRRQSIVLGNLVAALAVTALQIAVLIGAAALRGATFVTSSRVLWFLAGGALLVVVMYSLAEVLSIRLGSPEEYTGSLPVFAIVPFFFAGSLYPITSLPHWLADAAKVLPLTHALALFRYGLTTQGGQALHNIWGMTNDTAMALLSLAVLAAYAVAALAGAVRLFTKTCTS